MAPETISMNVAEPRSDLYALGCVLHEMLTGRPAFCADSAAVVLVRQLDDPPPPLPADVPPTLRQLVLALLAKDPDQRPANALTVCAVLEHCLAAELVAEMPTRIEPTVPPGDDEKT